MKDLVSKQEVKRKLVFALIMGMITTGIISFALIAINLGITESFLKTWIKSWILAYVFVIPAILFIAPCVERLVSRLV
ncbi:DUF2798 domain-containing protein [Winogradskyella sp.]|uniref:DUF2798 domain-containing protein n=1 Tax=Winogradskyella sp. TaxID=1883156 RepID=UPI002638A5DB|nr:DUF2798 domain-containing protein [Winogradskyella sp.]